jgi:hypothetical protein
VARSLSEQSGASHLYVARQLLEPLNQQVLETMTWLKAASQNDVWIARLRTHPGIGLLTSLCLVHSLQPVLDAK